MNEMLALIKPVDENIRQLAKERTTTLVMPYRAMGEINTLAEKLCAISGSLTPSVDKKALFVMAGDHGVCVQGVSAYHQEVTIGMMSAMLEGKCAVAVYAEHVKAKKILVDMGTYWSTEVSENSNCVYINKKIARSTQDFTKGAAMSRQQAECTVKSGFEVADKLIKDDGLNLVALGELGIGNTTASAAVAVAMLHEKPENIAGRGTGLDDAGLMRKIEAIKKGLEINRNSLTEPLGVLASVGGFEIGGLVGVILACAVNRVPVVLDGFISGAAALIAVKLCPHVLDYLIAGHLSDEAGHRAVLNYLGLKPLLNLGMRLGEGTGAVCAMPLVEMAVATITEIATFKEAGIIYV